MGKLGMFLILSCLVWGCTSTHPANTLILREGVTKMRIPFEKIKQVKYFQVEGFELVSFYLLRKDGTSIYATEVSGDSIRKTTQMRFFGRICNARDNNTIYMQRIVVRASDNSVSQWEDCSLIIVP